MGGKPGFQSEDGVEEALLNYPSHRLGVVESGEEGDPALGEPSQLRDGPEKMQLPVPQIGTEGDVGDCVHGEIRTQTGAVRQQLPT